MVGAGVSALLIDLVGHGYRALAAVDLSAVALDQLRVRLGAEADVVEFICADGREVRFDQPIRVWHDRAMFHFFTDPADQQRYVQRVEDAVAPGGHLVLATFAADGPESCSGLPVTRNSAEDLVEMFRGSFDLVDSTTRDHVTPWGAAQSFTHALFARRSS